MRFADTVRQTMVMPSSVALFWLGQAGFLIKTAENRLLLIDPYLSDSVFEQTRSEFGYAFKRVAPALFEPEEIEADWIFCSHEHGDHLDTVSLPALMKGEKTRLYTNPASVEFAKSSGAPADQIVTIRRDMRLDFGSFALSTLTAQHGDLSPEAMGFLFDFGFSRIYYSGTPPTT